MSAMLKLARAMVRRSCCCTAGPMTFSFVDVAPLLAAKGYRVIVPYLRGYGATRFLSVDTPRNGQQAALAIDTIKLLDALRIDNALLGGCDWGARTVDIVAAVWPQRVRGLVAVSGYL